MTMPPPPPPLKKRKKVGNHMSLAFHAGKGDTLSVKGLQDYGCFVFVFVFSKSLIIALKGKKLCQKQPKT